MKTRDKIIHTSLKLFNQQGTKAISTNHIADEMGISIGNLYYYFKNKEEIIREIFVQIAERSQDLWNVTEEQIHSFAFMEKIYLQLSQIQYEFRFFHNEITALLMRDEVLKKRYHTLHQLRFSELEQLIKQLMEMNYLKPEVLEVYSDLTQAAWVIWTFWITHLEISQREINEQEIRRGVEILVGLYQPFMTDIAKEKYAAFKQRWNLVRMAEVN